MASYSGGAVALANKPLSQPTERAGVVFDRANFTNNSASGNSGNGGGVSLYYGSPVWSSPVSIHGAWVVL